jgi:transcriptional regulator with XRE-family HTH domain
MTKTKKRLPIGTFLRAARRSARIDQNELARRAGIAPRTLSRYELGRIYPKRAVLLEIVAAVRTIDTAAADTLAKSVGLVLPEAPEVTEKRKQTLDAATYLAADVLDVTAAKLRGALGHWLTLVRAAGLSLEDAERLLRDKVATSVTASG